MDTTYNLNGGFKPTIKRSADLSGPDFFPTPRWATFALIDNENFSGDIWECACGDGSMSRVLEETGRSIQSTDLYERGYGEAGHDFLEARQRMPNIVTNPPYNSAEGFAAIGTKLADQKFALGLATPRFLRGCKACKYNLFSHSAFAGLGVQRAHHLLYEERRAKGNRNYGICVVRVG